MDKEMLCLHCSLPICDEDSVVCLYSLAAQPNPAQRAIIKREKQLPRKKYFRDYYQANRDAKLAAANERYRKTREGKRL
jgi:hypothetical protein